MIQAGITSIISTSAEEFCASVESGELPVDSHDRVLQIAYIYSYDGLWDDHGVFNVVDKLHARGWSFGQGDLKFNRTLDIFYLAQIGAGINRYSEDYNEDYTDDDFPSIDDFDKFYAQHHQLLNQDAWRQYYSPSFLAQATSARLFRLPDLQDATDSSGPPWQMQQKGIGHFTKLPRWAYNAARTARRSPNLSVATITQIALSTLEQTISRLRKDHPSVQPYSATQASFWLKRMKIGFPGPTRKTEWRPNQFDVYAAQGGYDMCEWEAHYSPKLWDSMEARVAPLEPDLDGTRKSKIRWCGMPDGCAVEWDVRRRGWEPELGSEEEIEFLAAIAAKETEGIEVGDLDYAMRSHMLLGVMHVAFETEREKHIEDLKRAMVEAGRIDEGKAEQWIQEVLMVMEPYVRKGDVWPASRENRGELLRHILAENGQVFARWKLPPTSKEFDFKLNTKEKDTSI
ncbi:hypothetical protein VE03_01392 [Pseudogymnoascus sp. 23342-1-I1]|nr:hypothetical protein VE03_01392 [Pseudogymnoascus sp. 23342-1-I1]